MNKTKLMKLYDKSYDEILSQIMRVTPDREEAKKLLGIIYKETWNKVSHTNDRIENIEQVFKQSIIKHGILGVL